MTGRRAKIAQAAGVARAAVFASGVLACAMSAFASRAAWADEPERTPLPGFMAQKNPMSPSDLANKVEGRYFTGLPLANSDPDTGFGFGARAYLFDDGPRSDAMFDYTPYRHRAYAQAFLTTNGYQYHTLDYDAPYVAREPLRLRASFVYEKNIAANYFGTGPRSLGRLSFPGDQRVFSSMAEYTSALRALRPDGTAYTRYNQYRLDRPQLSASVERDLFGGVVRALAGFTASYVGVRQWTGRTIDADDGATGRSDVGAAEAPTRLDEDCAAGRVRGCAGGFDNTLKLGVALDTRDFEPDPNSGVFVDLTAELAGRPIGSEYDYVRVTFSPRVYWSPLAKLTDLTLAARVVGSVQTADVPFFSMNSLSFTDWNRQGLGGLRTIRGYNQDRFVGRAVALANVELRWTFVELDATKGQHFAFMLVPFFDVGRVFDTIDDFELARFRNGQGAGLRIAWNKATIIAVDYGVTREGPALYVNFNHPF